MRTPRPFRVLMRLSWIFLALSLVGLAVLPLVPLTPLKPMVEAKLSAILGRPVTVSTMHLKAFGRPRLIINGLAAREDAAYGNGNFLVADEVQADLDAVEFILRRQLRIDALAITSPTIDLVKNDAGSWNWTTLGKDTSGSGHVAVRASNAATPLLSYFGQLFGSMSVDGIEKFEIRDASLKLIDRASAGGSEVLYRKINITATLSPGDESSSGDVPQSSRKATGTFTSDSPDDGEAQLFKASLPFDLTIKRFADSALSVSGSVGAGPFETRNVRLGAFSIAGTVESRPGTPLTGSGELSASDMFVPGINLSQYVANALSIDQIGDMSAGTSIKNLHSGFQLVGGNIKTSGLRIEALDGLGDATAPAGEFGLAPALTVNYSTTVVLSPATTARIKTVNTVFGLVATLLERNSQLSVPINVKGDVRQPEVRVDASRIF